MILFRSKCIQIDYPNSCCTVVTFNIDEVVAGDGVGVEIADVDGPTLKV